MNNIQELLGTISIEIADLVAERNAARTISGKITAENHALRDRLAKTDGVLMELCQLLGLDPTGDPVAEIRARIADAPRLHRRAIDGHWEDPQPAAKAPPPKPIDVAREVWPGAWFKDGDSLMLSLADTSSPIHAKIEVVFRATYWCVHLGNRDVWTLLARCSDLTDALTIARGEMRQTVADLAKGVG